MNYCSYYGGFFEYKDNLVGYNGQDYMSVGQFVFLFIAILAIILLSVFLRKIEHKKIDKLLKILAIIIPLLEVTKIFVESYFDIKYHGSFNFSGLLPLYTCSLFISLIFGVNLTLIVLLLLKVTLYDSTKVPSTPNSPLVIFSRATSSSFSTT